MKGVIVHILLDGDVYAPVHLAGQPGVQEVHAGVEVGALIVGEVGVAILEGGVKDTVQGSMDLRGPELQEGGEVIEPRALHVGHDDLCGDVKLGKYKIARRGLILFSLSAARLEGVGVVEARPGLGEEETGNVALGDPGQDVGVADPLGGAWSAGEDEPGSLSLAMVLAILEGLTWC